MSRIQLRRLGRSSRIHVRRPGGLSRKQVMPGRSSGIQLRRLGRLSRIQVRLESLSRIQVGTGIGQGEDGVVG